MAGLARKRLRPGDPPGPPQISHLAPPADAITTPDSNNSNSNSNNSSTFNIVPADGDSQGVPGSADADKNGKKRRTNYACVRCRKRHIKCPGGNPCQKCKLANSVCEYAEADKKVVVSMKYLQRLHDEIAGLKKLNANLRSKERPDAGALFVPLSLGDNIGSPSDSKSNSNVESAGHNSDGKAGEKGHAHSDALDKARAKDGKYLSEVVPPFVDRQRRLVSSKTGEKFYVGSSSMTLFGLEVESMIPDNVIRSKVKSSNGSNLLGGALTDNTKPQKSSFNGEMNPNERLSTVLEREGNAYRIYLGKTETRPGISVKFTLPSYSYAMLLIDTFITYNDGCFYFFNEGLVKESLRKTYSSNLSNPDKKMVPTHDSIIETINFCKFLLIFAVGEMYLGTANDNNGIKLASPRLPGSGFFQQASELFTGLFASGAIDNVAREGGVEVMLLYAFYLQVADCTAASYFYFGIALRASLILGMHVDVEKDTLTRFELEHRRRLWWTVYMFERMLSSKAGLPLSLSDDSISTELPQDFDMSTPPKGCEHYIFPEAEYIKNCVTIVQINALILSSLYQKEPTTNILPVIAELITKLFKWKESLPDFLKPNFSTANFKISRLVTNIMTEYFQGINLAVRPLLFYLTTKQIKINKTSDVYIDLTKYSESILTLLNASFQGSINTIRSLWALMPENMVALFGYMDREYLFTSAATLILFNVAFGVHEATKDHLDHALCMFTKMRNLGNNPAELRRAQLLKLMQTLNFNKRMEDLIKKFDDNADEALLDKGRKTRNRGNSSSSSSSSVNGEKRPGSIASSSHASAASNVTSATFSKKLLNKEKRKQVNNNRFIYQKYSNSTNQNQEQGQDAPHSPGYGSGSTPGSEHYGPVTQNHNISFASGNVHDINDIISISAVNHPVSNTRSEVMAGSGAHRMPVSMLPMVHPMAVSASMPAAHDHLHGMDFTAGNTNTSTTVPLASTEHARVRHDSSISDSHLAHPHYAAETRPEVHESAPTALNHRHNNNNNNSNLFGQALLSGTGGAQQHSMLEALIRSDFTQPYASLSTSAIDNELWDEITNQPTWLNDVSEEFQNLMDNIK